MRGDSCEGPHGWLATCYQPCRTSGRGKVNYAKGYITKFLVPEAVLASKLVSGSQLWHERRTVVVDCCVSNDIGDLWIYANIIQHRCSERTRNWHCCAGWPQNHLPHANPNWRNVSAADLRASEKSRGPCICDDLLLHKREGATRHKGPFHSEHAAKAAGTNSGMLVCISNARSLSFNKSFVITAWKWTPNYAK